MRLKFWEKEARASIENPSTPLSAANIAGDKLVTMGFSSATTKSGQAVGPDTAWNYSAVYAAIRLLSETVAQLPLVLHQNTGGTRSPAEHHPLYGLMHDNPAPNMTSFVWRETQMNQVLSWGNGYAYIEREASSDRVMGLRLLSSKDTKIEIDGGDLVYVTQINDVEYRIDSADVLHIPAMGTDGIRGKSPIALHRETIGLSMKATEFGAEFFGNGASLGGVLKHPKGLGPEGRIALKKAWDNLKGTGYQGVAVLEEGMDYARIGIPPNDAQFLETRKFQISEVARIYNIPTHMLRDLEKSAFNNMTEQNTEFLRFTMTPWLVKWEQELNRKLLTAEEIAQGYYFKFMATGLLRGTQSDRYTSYGQAINDGWLSRNEVRALEDMNQVEGLDDYLVPLNMAPSGNEDPANDDDELARFMPVIDQAVDAMSAFDRRCLRDACGDADKLAAIYVKSIPEQLLRHIGPIATVLSPRRSQSIVAAFGQKLGDARADGMAPLDRDTIKHFLVTTLGATNEN